MKITIEQIVNARILVKKHCAQYISDVSKNDKLTRAQKKAHYNEAYYQRDERLFRLMEIEHDYSDTLATTSESVRAKN